MGFLKANFQKEGKGIYKDTPEKTGFALFLETLIRALRNAYVGRRLKKRDFRRLWIARINAASRMNGLSYSKFMNGMKLAGIDMNRKMLSEIAINDPKAFADLVEVAKAQLSK